MFSTYFAQPPMFLKRPFSGQRLEMWTRTAEVLDANLAELPEDVAQEYADQRGILQVMIAEELDNDPLKPTPAS